MHARRRWSLPLLMLFLVAAAAPGSLRAQSVYPPNGPTIAPVPLNGSAAPPYPTPNSPWYKSLPLTS